MKVSHSTYEAPCPYAPSRFAFFSLSRPGVSEASIGELILPAQTPRLKEKFSSFLKPESEIDVPAAISQCNALTTVTYDREKLNGVELIHAEQEKRPVAQQEYVIYFCGNAMCYEQILKYEMMTDALELKMNVVGFNYRGVNNSAGKTIKAKNLITDGIAQVQRLVDKGVDPEKIVVKGHSLGAAVATLVASHFHEKDIRINLFNGRSFGELGSVVKGWIEEASEGFFGFSLSACAVSAIDPIFYVSKWSINVTDKFEKIPAAYKEYMYVEHDPVITERGSLKKSLKKDKKELKLLEKKAETDDGLTMEEQKKLDRHYMRRMCKPDLLDEEGRIINGHVVPLDSLRSYYSPYITAQDFFYQFVQEIRERNLLKEAIKPLANLHQIPANDKGKERKGIKEERSYVDFIQSQRRGKEERSGSMASFSSH